MAGTKGHCGLTRTMTITGKELRSMKVRTRPVVRQADKDKPFILKLPRELVVKPILYTPKILARAVGRYRSRGISFGPHLSSEEAEAENTPRCPSSRPSSRSKPVQSERSRPSLAEKAPWRQTGRLPEERRISSFSLDRIDLQTHPWSSGKLTCSFHLSFPT